jgi:ubiquinone/menaquinone biosynthesis C-methylase UbiE
MSRQGRPRFAVGMETITAHRQPLNPQLASQAASDDRGISRTVATTQGSRFTAGVYDAFLWLGEKRGMQSRRGDLLRAARGVVLEIGAGTGLNVDHYPADISQLVLTEPSVPMADRIRSRRSRLGRSAHVLAASAEALPFQDGSFDTVVSTLVLCTVPDPEAAMAEVRRVLRPGGRLLFCEHVRSDSPGLASRQEHLADAWAAIADGCRCNRDSLSTISSHLDISTLGRATWRGMPPIVHPLIVGEAVR